jgi:uncharacterized protein
MGEVVVVKGGYILSRTQRDQISRELGPSEIQITEDLFIGPSTERQREGGMMHLNHSCEPNLGLQGQIVFLALRDIRADEEVTFDYAMTDDEAYEMKCRCGTPSCRGTITALIGSSLRFRASMMAIFRGSFSEGSTICRGKHHDNRCEPFAPRAGLRRTRRRPANRICRNTRVPFGRSRSVGGRSAATVP